MSQKISPKLLALTFGVLVVLFVVGFYVWAQWQEPTVAPPGGDVPPPINVGGTPQTKSGNLTVANMSAANMYAGMYYDTNPSYYIDPGGNSNLNGNVTIASGSIYAASGSIYAALGNIYAEQGTVRALKFEDATAGSFFLNPGKESYLGFVSIAPSNPSQIPALFAPFALDVAGNINIRKDMFTQDTNYYHYGNKGKTITCDAASPVLKQITVSGGIVTGGTCAADDSGAGGAPINASYVVLGLDSTLTAERKLTAGTGISITDGGANGNVTINNTGVTGEENLRIVRGTVNNAGTPIAGSGFTVMGWQSYPESNEGSGWTIQFTNPFPSRPTVVATITAEAGEGASGDNLYVRVVVEGDGTVKYVRIKPRVRCNPGDADDTPASFGVVGCSQTYIYPDCCYYPIKKGFSFIAVGPRQ